MVPHTHLVNFKMETYQDIVVMDPTQQSILLLITHSTFVCQLEMMVTTTVTQLIYIQLVSHCGTISLAFVYMQVLSLIWYLIITCVYLLVCIYIHIRTYMYIHTYTYVYVRMYLHVKFLVSIHSYVATFKWWQYVCS